MFNKIKENLNDGILSRSPYNLPVPDFGLKDGIVDNPVDREKRILSSLIPEDLLPENPEIIWNPQHQLVR
ncbi:hypothetical protein O3M35_010254 [Rhynocoris fuscipes]|uniref:Uncharacterized protein n=1 Tax=Rhynocoris fuscipes TaxID=488301 RepID=A0AAW1D3P2_9HEMI